MYSLTLIIAAGLSAAGADPVPFYADKLDLTWYLEPSGERRPIASAADWAIRRAHVRAGFQQVAGPLPSREHPGPLDLQVESEEDFPKYVRKKITFAVEPWDRLPAYLLIPKGVAGQMPAVLCLHPTADIGKDVVVGLGGKENRQYAEELAGQGFVTLAPDYPGFGDYKDARQRAYARGYTSMTMKGIWNHMPASTCSRACPKWIRIASAASAIPSAATTRCSWACLMNGSG